MRLNKLVVFTSVIVLLCLLCSCVKGGSKLRIEVSPNKNLIDLSSTVYEKKQLLEISEFNGSLSELNIRYPIECLRLDSENYRVSYLGDGCVTVLRFDKFGNKLLGSIYSTQHLKSDFDGLVKGMLLKDVRKIDPEGEYLFLYTGRNDTPKVSSHYTKDGYLITIEYDVSNVIISINEELI